MYFFKANGEFNDQYQKHLKSFDSEKFSIKFLPIEKEK
jgi:hypothetical protein